MTTEVEQALAETMNQLEAMGSEQTKKTYLRHGAIEPIFGVKVGDMKKLVKGVKRVPGLPEALYATGNYDAMYLAGLTIDPKKVDKALLESWVKQANWYSPAEYTVAWVAAESRYGAELAREWIQSPDEIISTCGWSTYASYLSITPDDKLDLEEIRQLLRQVETTIHQERNRVRYTMNGFVIAVGSYVIPMHDDAEQVAETIGKVDVNVGQTACKVPLASEYIEKVLVAGKVGAKRKTCIC
jgi:3-methyladenine DNA glycosylase AlkD